MSKASGQPYFDSHLLSRCTISPEDARAFRDEARQRILYDPDTRARVVCYVHPDGRILIDAIRLPVRN